MNTEAEIRVKGMQALIGALGLVDAERFMAANSRDRFKTPTLLRFAGRCPPRGPQFTLGRPGGELHRMAAPGFAGHGVARFGGGRG
jgi:hypothetical protein